jgi:hypothetical protein
MRRLVAALFSDNVHLSDVGRYYIALLHYSVLFGRSPEGVEVPASLSPETGRYMQTLAWRYAVSYGQRADAAARLDMAACRKLMLDEVCPAYATSVRSIPIFAGASMPTGRTLKTRFLRPRNDRSGQRGPALVRPAGGRARVRIIKVGVANNVVADLPLQIGFQAPSQNTNIRLLAH